MAEEDLKTGEEGKKKSKLMLIIIIAVVLLGGGGAGAYFFLMADDSPAGAAVATGGTQPDELVSDSSGRALFVAMPRPFQFNAPGVSRERLVQIEVQLMVRGQVNEERAKRHIPMIEGTLLRVFSTSNADDLVTEVGKADLRSRSTSQVRQVMNDLEDNPVIEEVLFTGFVIQ
ncbi:flagellar basal body-associated protein FliL [Glaciecola sp. XM2]|jgi:flagellar FliL protein|uniref:flagellar basal body-associated protein FliL n=1 Tax=Glaciecola sp. XM2 TaxID=1914931 RepID=UPI001BDF2E3B|nr:flagellar basal body-associated protein FliL [Glaciecola sp. XM2]MBT1450826.1 flagellar basal body-associated protein FliL [Glaciecola sp. XM2]